MSVVSVRIDRKVRRVLEEAGINISQEIKKFLNELAFKIEVQNKIKAFKESVGNIPPPEKGYSAKSVREDREGN